MRWESESINGEIVADGKGKRLDQLFGPYAILIDQIHDRLIVSENMNRRIMQFSLQNNDEISGKVLVRDIVSLGFAMDHTDSSDFFYSLLHTKCD